MYVLHMFDVMKNVAYMTRAHSFSRAAEFRAELWNLTVAMAKFLKAVLLL